MPSTVFKLKFDVASLRKDCLGTRRDALACRNNVQTILGSLDARAIRLDRRKNLFDSFRYGGTPQVYSGRLTVAARQPYFLRNRLDVLRFDKTGGFCPCQFNVYTFQNSGLAFRFDSINSCPNGVGRLVFTYELRWSYLWKIGNRFQVFSDDVARLKSGRFSVRYHSRKPVTDILPIRFDYAPSGYRGLLYNRFDSAGYGLYLHPARKQAFVKPGWRIVAKNILTSEILDLGFIDAASEKHSLENIDLPIGDYEISVLASSLFWKDASDFEVRLLSLRSGEEVTSLPTIYNLRSSVSQGETTIYWSANHCDLDDCVFGVWYSSSSPVSTDGPPSETVWYFSEMTEYQVSFGQVAPCYAAVAAIRPGDNPEIGKIHELFLDWSMMPPRAPDDVIVIDVGE
ncbi:MAG: hypothetical protein LBI05_09190 [Planctomycetaceae bacterium]|jgi:hypothetical protein|nr:hypothetical protein [Planctomycetaceae bacterium]